MRKFLLAFLLALSIAPAVAQVPPPVPALPDTERRTSYSISASLCSCNVGFQLYADSTDVQNWLEVFVNGVLIPQSGGWAITSPTGPIATIPRPITDAVLTFMSAQTGTVQIVGARRPRRTTQFQESQPVPTRNFNQIFSDIIATQRELWDKTNDFTGRGVFGRPGETLAMLPVLASRANMGACFDSGGNLTSCVGASAGSFVAGAGITFTGANPTAISCSIFNASLPGCVPASGGSSTSLFLNQAGGFTAPAGSSNVVSIVIQPFVATGTYTPSTGMTFAILECVGGGGGGGSAAGTAGQTYGGGGGGSGSYSVKRVTAADIGASKAVTIGAGGAGGVSGSNNGAAGGDTSIGALVIAKGGFGGTFGSAAQASIGGDGGVIGTGTPAAAGNPGFPGPYSSISTVVTASGTGGSSALGGGGLGVLVPSAATAGIAGRNGSGGSGALAMQVAANAAGGAGAAGYCIATELLNQ